MTTSSLIRLGAIDLRQALVSIAELQDLRTEHSIPLEVSLHQAIAANMISKDRVFAVVRRGGADEATD